MSAKRPNSPLQNPKSYTKAEITHQLERLRISMSRYITKCGITPPDDILQDIAVAVYKAKSISTTVEAYIIGCMNRIVINHLRDDGRRIDKPSVLDSLDTGSCGSYIQRPEIEQRIELEASMFRFAQKMKLIDKNLKPFQAKVLRMSFENGLTPKQIALRLGVGRPRVSQEKKRALQKIRVILAQRENTHTLV